MRSFEAIEIEADEELWNKAFPAVAKPGGAGGPGWNCCAKAKSRFLSPFHLSRVESIPFTMADAIPIRCESPRRPPDIKAP